MRDTIAKQIETRYNDDTVKHLKQHNVSFEQLLKKLDVEARRLVREREDGIVKYVSKEAILEGDSKMIFRNRDGAEVTLSFRLNEDGNLRLAHDKRFDKV